MKAVLVALALAVAGTASAKSYTVKSGAVEFQATGNPGFLRINGKGAKVTGSAQDVADGKLTGEFKVELAGFTTGMGLRDDHMKNKYLEVGKYPTATLTLEPVAVVEGKQFDWTGTLEIKGVKKPVKGTGTLSKGVAHADFDLVCSDYPIGVPDYMGVKMADKVHVVVDAEVQ